MDDALALLFGEGRELGVLQMCARAVVAFLLLMLMVRISGRRSLGRRTAFDFVVAILLGAVMSRAIVGVSPFVPTTAASFAIAFLHRLMAWLFIAWPAFDRFCNGRDRILYRDGTLHPDEMRRGLISQDDLAEGARISGRSDIDAFDEIRLERSGRLSYQKRGR